jgi:hemerythrin-like metal-binding protein
MCGIGAEAWRQTGERFMDAKYLLGIQEIDVQHSGIFAAIEPLQKAASEEGQAQALVPALWKLRELLVNHFDFEESFMGAIACPDQQEHQRRHAEIRQLLDDCINTVAPASPGENLGRTIGDRISSHLLEYDVQMEKTVELLVRQFRNNGAEEER